MRRRFPPSHCHFLMAISVWLFRYGRFCMVLTGALSTQVDVNQPIDEESTRKYPNFASAGPSGQRRSSHATTAFVADMFPGDVMYCWHVHMDMFMICNEETYERVNTKLLNWDEESKYKYTCSWTVGTLTTAQTRGAVLVGLVTWVRIFSKRTHKFCVSHYVIRTSFISPHSNCSPACV